MCSSHILYGRMRIRLLAELKIQVHTLFIAQYLSKIIRFCFELQLEFHPGIRGGLLNISNSEFFRTRSTTRDYARGGNHGNSFCDCLTLQVPQVPRAHPALSVGRLPREMSMAMSAATTGSGEPAEIAMYRGVQPGLNFSLKARKP